MDWNKLGKHMAGAAIKAVGNYAEEAGRMSEKMSRDSCISEEKREEYKNKAETYKRGANAFKEYYSDFSRDDD